MIFVWIEVTRDDSPVTEPETRNGQNDSRHSGLFPTFSLRERAEPFDTQSQCKIQQKPERKRYY